ncbi:hypothetical protein HPB51_015207 [Rhipicephalus microplus]|uniref:Uncharacterized protein n=1 Tax=Rhipicephalus microplus TaxID=6941 RepID=A0A9J6EAZ1_RHIMP|nr:hypothetical protein HPB51_015207 [Rhipicephalus microplus]
MQEFLELQTKRRLQSHETDVEYMYSKNAILNKAPYRLAEEERISLILSGIEDDTWANPLAAQLCGTVTELIDRVALLTVCAENDKKLSSSTARRGQAVAHGPTGGNIGSEWRSTGARPRGRRILPPDLSSDSESEIGSEDSAFSEGVSTGIPPLTHIRGDTTMVATNTVPDNEMDHYACPECGRYFKSKLP